MLGLHAALSEEVDLAAAVGVHLVADQDEVARRVEEELEVEVDAVVLRWQGELTGPGTGEAVRFGDALPA